VRIGQAVAVTADAFPERTFTGEVANIAGEAEFTPQNVQTQASRVNLVFAVKVRIPNPDRALKLGMPADAVIRP
jgi:HlyD family secretion protein